MRKQMLRIHQQTGLTIPTPETLRQSIEYVQIFKIYFLMSLVVITRLCPQP